MLCLKRDCHQLVNIDVRGTGVTTAGIDVLKTIGQNELWWTRVKV
jgi:hypothetical protein